MSGRFAAFSFVDRIDSIEIGKAVSGRYSIPEPLGDFRHGLCCEAVGQCAAWSAMAALDFQFRPVAGISRSIEFFGEAKPGDTLVMTVEISRADAEAVTFDGVGTVNGREIVKLNQCLGPMLPMEDFDAPELVRARYETLLDAGAEPGLFSGVPEFNATVTSREEFAVDGRFAVPEEGVFFEDHFPRNPVFPGTLFLDLCVHLAGQLVAEGMRPSAACNAKLRNFMEPGAELAVRAELESVDDGVSTVAVLQTGGKRAKRLVEVLFEPTSCHAREDPTAE